MIEPVDGLGRQHTRHRSSLKPCVPGNDVPVARPVMGRRRLACVPTPRQESDDSSDGDRLLCRYEKATHAELNLRTAWMTTCSFIRRGTKSQTSQPNLMSTRSRQVGRYDARPVSIGTHSASHVRCGDNNCFIAQWLTHGKTTRGGCNRS